MKTFWKRLLAVSLSAALLISCAVSGLVLPAAAQTTTPESSALINLFPDDDFGEEFAAKVTISNSTAADYLGKVEVDPTAGINGTPALKIAGKTDWHSSMQIKFDEPLKAGKFYILRMKSKGAGSDNKFFLGAENTAQYLAGIGTTQIIRSSTEWSELQSVIAPIVDISTLTNFYFYNKSTEPGYIDDIRIYEYTPGMNYYPDEWEPTSQPYLYSSTGNSNIFSAFTNNVYEKETPESSNYVQKFTAGSGVYLKLGSMSKFIYDGGIIGTNKPFFISFKYKGVEGTASASIAINTTKGGSILKSESSAVDADGWKTFSAYLQFERFDANWQWMMSFTGASTIMVDDIFIGEMVEAQIEEESVVVEEGKTVALTATAFPTEAPILWSSSNNDIATVDQSGVVTAIKPGKVTITATAQGGKSDTCLVTVNAKPAVDIADGAVTMERGTKLELTYTAAPEGVTVTWESDDETIATVANGVVTALKPGTVTITAKLTDDVYDTCEVTVTSIAPGTNLIANGDLEGAEWTGSKIAEGQGYGGGKAFTLTSGASGIPAALQLKEPLDPQKWYVYRFKARGDMAKTYITGVYNFMNTNPTNVAAYKNAIDFANNWVQYQTHPFQPTQEISSIPGASVYLYKAGVVEGSAAVYYDDFEIFEYVPGMNIVPGTDGDILSVVYGGYYSSGVYHPLQNFFAAGATFSLANDNGNSVWKLNGLNATETNYVVRTDTLVYHLVAGKTGRLSFRFKGANVSLTAANAAIATEPKVQISEADENGWKTATAEFDILSTNYNGPIRLVFSGSTEVLIDDFSLVEVVEEPIEDFSIEMLGLGIHWPNGVEATQANADGVRFGARLYFGEGFPTINEETGMLQLPYGGEYCDVVSVGTLLRRHADGDLTVANATWKSEAYSSTTNKFKCIVKTDTYLDFAVNMMAGENVSTEVFNARNYDARGYVQLSNGETIYTGVVTNGIDAYFATQQ